MDIKIPEKFKKDIIKLKGEEGEKWILEIPRLLKTFSEKWELSLNYETPKLSFNFIAFAKDKEDQKVVLKFYFPDFKEFKNEFEALKAYKGQGMVRLLKFDEDFRVMLLERLNPGKELKTLGNEEEEIKIAASLMKKFWIEPPITYEFPKISDWFNGLKRYKEKYIQKEGPVPEKLVVMAESLYYKLISTSGQQVLLHGDLHYENILSSENGWKSIDPKGVIGEREYEIGALLRNPMPEMLSERNLKEVLIKRVKLFSKFLELDQERILSWAKYQAVLSVIWGIEDFENSDNRWLKIAQILSEIEV